MSFRNVVAFKNGQLVPKPASTDKLTPVTAHSRLKKCMHKTLTQQKLNTVWISFYRSDGLKFDFATTKLAATINVWNTTPFWNGITLIAGAWSFWVSIKLLQLTLQDANTKTSTFKRDIFVFVPENWLLIYLLRTHSHRQSILILKADFCIFSFVYDEAISTIQCRQHKNPNNQGYSIC